MERNNALSQSFQIDSISCRVEDIGFNTPVHLPFGEIHSRPSLVVESLVSRQAISSRGVAEGASLPMPIPMYDDCSPNLVPNAEAIVPHLVGKEVALQDVQRIISSVDLGGNFATARMSIEASIIDAYARLEGQSVYNLLTEHSSPVDIRVPYGKSITEVTAARMKLACQDAIASGARRLKFKISPNSFDEVYPTLRDLMHKFPGYDFMVDANGMFDPSNTDHVEMLRRLDELGMLTIEEPVSRVGAVIGLDAHRLLRDKLKLTTPVTIDDAIKTDTDAYEALSEDLAEVINLKPGRMGSFLRCVELAHVAARMRKQVMVGGMFEASPGRYMTTTLAAYCIYLGFTIPGDLSLPEERLMQDIGKTRLNLDSDGNIIFKPELGWGYDIESI